MDGGHPASKTFSPNLDFLRALAVTLVVIDHSLLAFRTGPSLLRAGGLLGIIGVYMFFVHTSLVLMWSLQRRPYTADFYIRRIFRIYPLALVATLIAIATRAPVLGTVDSYFAYQKTSPGNLLATSLLVYNLLPTRMHYHPIVNVMWTLPLEMEMYIALPLLFAFAFRERSIWPLLFLWCISFSLAMQYSNSGLTLISAVPDFLAGVIAFVIFMHVRPTIPSWLFPLFLGVLIAITLYVAKVSLGPPFCLVLGLSLPYFRQFRISSFTRVCGQIAKYSYGVYLVHPFALVLGPYLLSRHSPALQLAVEVATIVIGSIVSFHVIEKPLIDLGARVAARMELRLPVHNSLA